MSGSHDQENYSTNDDFMSTPLKNYVTFVGEKKDNKWICNFGCRVDAYTGTYSRIRAHLIGVKKGEKNPGIVLCNKLKPEDREPLRKEEEDARSVYGGAIRKRKKSGAPTPQEIFAGKRPTINLVKNMFKMSAIEDADARIGRFFFTCGIPFNVARSPSWIDAVKAINEAPRGYKPPSSEKIRTSLLDKEKIFVDNQLTILKRDWGQYGVTIVSDGWSNVRNQPLINVLAVCGGKPVFLTAVDSSGEEKNGLYIADLLLKEIESIGEYNIVQVVTDNASNCEAARKIIMDKYPHIFWSGCMPHTLSLLMKDIAQSKHTSLSFIGVCYSKVKEIVNYIRSHSFVLTMFRKFSSLEVIQVKKTIFGYHYVVIERLYKLKNSLIGMVLNEEWEEYRTGTSKSKLTHDEVKKTILDEQFWQDVKFVLSFTKPISNMILFCDSDKAVIGEVYQRMEDMLGFIKESLSGHLEMSLEVEELVMKRWEKMNLPLHALAYVLTPRYYCDAWLQSLGPGNKTRCKPHADSIVQCVYLSAVSKLTKVEDTSVIRMQLSHFTSDGGVFSKPEAIMDRMNMPAIAWWNLYGVAAPELYNLAIRVLSQTVNSSCAERVWSTYSFIHNVRRNKLNCSRAEALVYVHYNNRILTRYREDYETKHKDWDRNTYEDYLEGDIEAIEDQEFNALLAGLF